MFGSRARQRRKRTFSAGFNLYAAPHPDRPLYNQQVGPRPSMIRIVRTPEPVSRRCLPSGPADKIGSVDFGRGGVIPRRPEKDSCRMIRIKPHGASKVDHPAVVAVDAQAPLLIQEGWMRRRRRRGGSEGVDAPQAQTSVHRLHLIRAIRPWVGNRSNCNGS